MKCTSCAAPIVWLQTAAGRAMPVNPPADPAELFDPKRHVSHFATCPNADQHRRPTDAHIDATLERITERVKRQAETVPAPTTDLERHRAVERWMAQRLKLPALFDDALTPDSRKARIRNVLILRDLGPAIAGKTNDGGCETWDALFLRLYGEPLQ